MSKSSRRHHSPEQKAALLRRHLVDKVPVSEICNEHALLSRASESERNPTRQGRRTKSRSC